MDSLCGVKKTYDLRRFRFIRYTVKTTLNAQTLNKKKRSYILQCRRRTGRAHAYYTVLVVAAYLPGGYDSSLLFGN